MKFHNICFNTFKVIAKAKVCHNNYDNDDNNHNNNDYTADNDDHQSDDNTSTFFLWKTAELKKELLGVKELTATVYLQWPGPSAHSRARPRPGRRASV